MLGSQPSVLHPQKSFPSPPHKPGFQPVLGSPGLWMPYPLPPLPPPRAPKPQRVVHLHLHFGDAEQQHEEL